MATIKVSLNHTTRFGMSIFTGGGEVALSAVAGYTTADGQALHGYQKFFGKLDTALNNNQISTLRQINCTEPLALKFFPDNFSTFEATVHKFNVSGNSYVGNIALWTRYYVFQPAGVAQPLYLKFEGGIQGCNSSSSSGKRVMPYILVSMSYSFNEAIGFESEIASHQFSRHQTSDNIYNNGLLSVTGTLSAYITDDVFFISPFFNSLRTDSNNYIYAGRTNGFSTPKNIPSCFICCKSIAHIPGVGNRAEAIAFVPDRLGAATIAVDSTANNQALLSAIPNTQAGIVTMSGYEKRSPVCFAMASETLQAPPRTIVSPFTYVSVGGTVYQSSGIVHLTDPVKDILAVRDYIVNVMGVQRRVLICPLMLPIIRYANITMQSANSVVMGVVLDDTIIIS
ncbi:hypothetical protein ACG904_02015 [Acinetobacter guillouiae]|uniref:hypothetical protein n=1 Tax=Acinetobacter guillouiae TaxID=106649 RepID=UPI003AF72467